MYQLGINMSSSEILVNAESWKQTFSRQTDTPIDRLAESHSLPLRLQPDARYHLVCGEAESELGKSAKG
ncbi:MAG: hypothetical protein KAR40_13655 [Candidatus Sabulitectum sp.]|nr:hypothetical protein [Candidatus Sabulitectum sp.]